MMMQIGKMLNHLNTVVVALVLTRVTATVFYLGFAMLLLNFLLGTHVKHIVNSVGKVRRYA